MAGWTRFRRLFGPEPKPDVDEELAFHLEMRIRELVERGASPADARERALQRFGDYGESRTQCVEISERRRRRMARAEYMSELRQDVGYSVRMLRRTPGFTAVAVLTLALGIGATSAIFSVVHGVLLNALPFPEPERLFQIRTLYPDGTAYSLSAPDFMSIREESRAFERVEAFSGSVLTMLGVGEPQEVRGTRVSDGLFGLLGLTLVHGRGFVREDHDPGQGSIVVLDHGFWLRAFGGEPQVLGRSITLGGDLYRIVGVLASGARLPDAADLYVPLEYGETFSAAAASGRRSEFLNVLGRARLDMAAVHVDSDLKRIGTTLQAAFPRTNERLTFTARPLPDVMLGEVRTPLLVLFGAVAFVLLVACVNVANLLLARASVRQDELAVRAALGARRGRLVRQLLTESLVLGFAGGLTGLAIAYAGTRALVAAQPADLPRLDEIGVNASVVLFTLAVAVFTGIVFGILPAFQSSGVSLTRALRQGGRGGASGGQRIRSALVVVEVALAVILLVGAGLLIRSFAELTRVQPGFQPEHAMAFRITMQGAAYQTDEQLRARVVEVEERLRALPGVLVAGATTVLPLSGRGAMLSFAVEGAPPPPPDVNQEIAVARVTPDYFRAIGAPVRRGRTFTDQDRADAPPVALLNEAAARRWFPGEDPLGRRVLVDTEREVVGIVGDVLQWTPGQAALPQLFAPYAQLTARSVRFVVRTAGDPLTLSGAVRAEMGAIDPNLAISEFTPLEQLVSRSVARPRFYTALLVLFAGVALVLAGTGIFGVVSYTVTQRSREIGIRMALGASSGGVLRSVVGRAMALAIAGLLLGLAASLPLGRAIESQLFGVTLLDPWTFGGVTIVLAASAIVASVLPARRAATTDPASILRDA